LDDKGSSHNHDNCHGKISPSFSARFVKWESIKCPGF
jgi:hypothetical protein